MLKLKWRRKLLPVGSSEPMLCKKGGLAMSCTCKSHDCIKKDDLEGKPKKTKKPKWSLLRPPPVQTSYTKYDEDDMPRISNELTMQELQDEALARGIERKFIPTNKADLIDFLVDGSIHLRKTKAWQDVERLKAKMEEDCRQMEEVKYKGTVSTAGAGSGSDMESGNDKFDMGSLVMNNVFREFDVPDPFSFSERDDSQLSSLQSTHVFQSFNKQHDRSIISRQDRSVSMQRDVSFQTQADESAMTQLMRMVYGSCGVGGCNARTGNSDQSVKTADREKEKELEEVMERRNQIKEGRKIETKHQEEKWDENIQFEPWIISPPQNNKKPTGSNLKGFTVWCSISSDLLDSPPKQFDATFKSVGDANDRARYLFFWKNPWRIPPATMAELVVVKADNSDSSESASTFHCVHPNGDKWIVSVVHDSTFKYLDNASMTRHSLDQEF